MLNAGTLERVDARDARIPRLGIGTWDMRGSHCMRAVESALEAGYRHVDTAQMYENEEEVGKALRASAVPRSEIFLTTKIWYTNLHAGKVAAGTEQSLRRLRTEYVDLLLIHWPQPDVPLEETLEAMLRLRAAGEVRHIGVSNFPSALVAQAERNFPGVVVCNQVEYHFQLAQDRLHRQATELGIALTAYCPLAKGDAAKNRVLKKIGANHGKSAAQVALRWLLDHDNVVAIPKSASAERARENLDIFDFALDAAERRAIDELPKDRRHVRVPWAPDWD